jgi:hypothetical protein
MARFPAPEHLRDLIAVVESRKEIDLLTAAHLICAMAAPKGCFVAVGPVSREVRVCMPRKLIGMPDVMWPDWPTWRERWLYGPIDTVFGLTERMLPGVNFLYGRGRANSTELPYGVRLLFGMDRVLGQAEHEDGPSCLVLALLKALLFEQQVGTTNQMAGAN